MRIPVAIAALIACGCATETAAQRASNGTTMVAFSAPLIIGGTLGVLSSGVLAAYASAEPAAKQLQGPALGGVATGGVMLAIGLPLLVNGRSLVESAHAPPKQRAAADPNDDPDNWLPAKKPRSEKQCTPGWDCPVEDDDKGECVPGSDC